MQLICKWGCDGSQQTQFKQKIADDSGDACDANIFQSSFVPLRLVVKDQNSKVIWQNPVPSSPRFCRPIRIRYTQETVQVTSEENTYICNQITELKKTSLAGGTIFIDYKFLLTMVDTKVCNAITGTSSGMRCYICKHTSKEFNQLIGRDATITEETISFGLSVLHARIRFFEGLLHLSYKILIKKWQARSEEEKISVAAREKDIQDKFKRRLGLLVDIPKQGAGNTNDGNKSRRFFENAEISAQITGIDLNLILRFRVILEVLTSGFKVNVERFTRYADETANLYVHLYPWYPMTTTIHKILIHGGSVIKQSLLPIGQLSEEAAEARNKHFREYRSNFARKFDRTECNKDILNR